MAHHYDFSTFSGVENQTRYYLATRTRNLFLEGYILQYILHKFYRVGRYKRKLQIHMIQVQDLVTLSQLTIHESTKFKNWRTNRCIEAQKWHVNRVQSRRLTTKATLLYRKHTHVVVNEHTQECALQGRQKHRVSNSQHQTLKYSKRQAINFAKFTLLESKKANQQLCKI